MMKLRNKKGFTLIELMIVVVIIGILAALAIPRFMQASKKAKISEAKSVLKQVYELAAAYYEEKGEWPVTGGTDKFLNNGWTTIGLDAPSGKPRFAYYYTNNKVDASGSDILATATGENKGQATVDGSLTKVRLKIDATGVLQLSLDGGTSWE